jgi:rhodanese-related sulfurtransferase
MKKFLFQSLILLLISSAIGITYNQLTGRPLPIFEKFIPEAETDTLGSQVMDTGIREIQEVDADLLKKLVDTKAAILLDAREPGQYQRGHIPDALNLPISEFEDVYDKHFRQLGKNKLIITYCINFDCQDSTFLAQKLHRKGYADIMVYRGGIEEWQALGYPIETSE